MSPSNPFSDSPHAPAAAPAARPKRVLVVDAGGQPATHENLARALEKMPQERVIDAHQPSMAARQLPADPCFVGT